MTPLSVIILTVIALALGYALLVGAISGGIRHADKSREREETKQASPKV